jgi:hypothetical protein
MFGRRTGAAGVAAEALDTISPYADQLAHDDKLRRRLAAAIGAGLAAQERARRQAGIAGIATRLGTDPVLRAQVAEAIAQLRKAKGRMEHKRSRSHTVRNLVLFAVGIAAAAVAARKILSHDEADDSFSGEWGADAPTPQPDATAP